MPKNKVCLLNPSICAFYRVYLLVFTWTSYASVLSLSFRGPVILHHLRDFSFDREVSVNDCRFFLVDFYLRTYYGLLITRGDCFPYFCETIRRERVPLLCPHRTRVDRKEFPFFLAPK